MCVVVMYKSGGDDRGRKIGDGGTRMWLWETADVHDDGTESDCSLLVSPSLGIMSPSHSSSLREGQRRIKDFLRKTLVSELRCGELRSVGGIGTSPQCLVWDSSECERDRLNRGRAGASWCCMERM